MNKNLLWIVKWLLFLIARFFLRILAYCWVFMYDVNPSLSFATLSMLCVIIYMTQKMMDFFLLRSLHIQLRSVCRCELRYIRKKKSSIRTTKKICYRCSVLSYIQWYIIRNNKKAIVRQNLITTFIYTQSSKEILEVKQSELFDGFFLDVYKSRPKGMFRLYSQVRTFCFAIKMIWISWTWLSSL